MPGTWGLVAALACLALFFSCATDGPRRQYGPAGTLIEEAHYKNSALDGPYRQWYDHGQLKLEARYDRGRLDGPGRAWYENGKQRLEVAFDQGKRTGRWVRIGEKVGQVAEVHFQSDRLHGPLSVLVNRGTGSGRGTSFMLQAEYRRGVPVGCFEVRDTDDLGRSLALSGTLGPDGSFTPSLAAGLTIAPGGVLTVTGGRHPGQYRNAEELLRELIEARVLPLYTLEFCGINLKPPEFGPGR